MRLRAFLEHLHGHGDRLLELRIVTFTGELRILPHLNVWRDSVVFHHPMAVQSSNCPTRRRDAAAVHQIRITANPHQSTPCSHTHQRTNVGLTEVPGQRVAA